MATRESKWEVIYEAPPIKPRYLKGKAIYLSLIATDGNKPYPWAIKKDDALILLEIRAPQVCPSCHYTFEASNRIAYTIDNQLEMWKAIFNVKVLSSAKLKYADKFKALINDELLQTKLKLP